MYHINTNFIPRKNDRCFLDPINFKIYKLNNSGYEIISKLAKDHLLDLKAFVNICKSEGVFDADAVSFWTKCIESKLLIQSHNS